jgi:hypothetical protein
VTGLPQCVLDFYENVVMPLPEVTYRALMDQYTEYYGRTISQVHLKNKYTDPLVSTGYLFCDTHPEDKRKKLFEKLILPDEMKKKIKEYHTFVLKYKFSSLNKPFVNTVYTNGFIKRYSTCEDTWK